MSDPIRIDDAQGADNTHEGMVGSQVFAFDAGHGDDTIVGFWSGEDRIDLSAFTDITGFDDLTITADGDAAVIDLTAYGGGTIRLTYVPAGALDASDFLFGEATNDLSDVEAPAESLFPDPSDADAVDQGVNTIVGTDGDDRLAGSTGDNAIDGGAGDDSIFGNSGADTLAGGAGDDSLIGNDGDDALDGGAGNDWLVGGGGDDQLLGDAGNDRLIGAGGDDTLDGGAGDDALNGGAGDDTLTGGAGDDTFVFNGDVGTDVVEDFTAGADRIDLTALSDLTGFEDLAISADGDAVVIDLAGSGTPGSAGGTIRLENVAVDDLDAEDFSFYDPSTDAGEGM